MIFSSRCFFQKTNERVRLNYYDTSGRLVFIHFSEEIEDTKKIFRNSLTFKYVVNEKDRTHLLQTVVKKCINLLPQEISKEIFFLVASFVRKSLRIDMVEMLSDLNIASPFLWCNNIKRWDGIWGVGSNGYCMAEPIIQENSYTKVINYTCHQTATLIT